MIPLNRDRENYAEGAAPSRKAKAPGEEGAERGLFVLTGAQRAAILLSVMGEEVGAELLSQFDGNEIKNISSAMVTLSSLPGPKVAEVVEDFFDAVGISTYDVGGFEQTERLLRKALPEDVVKSIMQEVSSLSGVDIWRKLPTVDRGLLLSYLRGEHPQTVALILTQVGPDFASKVLKKFDRKLATEIIGRMLRMQPVQTDALNQVEDVLRMDFLAATAKRRKTDMHAAMAEIFNNFDGRTEAELMGELTRVNEVSAKKVQSLMFTFKDLIKLDAAAVQTLIQAVDKDVLPRALKSADETILNLFLGNMSARASKRVQDDMDALGNLSRSDLENAQGTILKITKGLMDKGEIRLGVEKRDDD